jgi:hypothetical protein
VRDLFAINAAMLLLVRCAATAGASSALVTAVDGAETVVNAFLIEAPLISAAFPTVLPASQLLPTLTNTNKTGFLDLAQADVTALLAMIQQGPVSDTTGATTLTTVVGYVNQAIGMASPVLTAVCGLVPQCSDAQAVYKSIVLAAPLIEMFISNVLPSSTVAQARLLTTRAAAVPSQGLPQMTPQAAIADLRARFGK